MLIEPIEARHYRASTPLIENDAIDQQIVSGDVIYYTEKVATLKQPDRVLLHRYRISTRTDTLLPSPDGLAWRKIDRLALGTEGLYFAGTSVDLKGLFFVGRTSDSVDAITTRKMTLSDAPFAATRDGGVAFVASDRTYGQEMYFHNGSSLDRLTDFQPGPRWSNVSAPRVSPQATVYFVDENSDTLYVSYSYRRSPSAVRVGTGDLSIVGFGGGEMLFVDDGDQKAYLTGNGTRGTRVVSGDYTATGELTRLIPMGTGGFAMSATSTSRGNEFWRIDNAGSTATPLPEITPGAGDGFETVINTFTAFGDSGFVANLSLDGTSFARFVSADRVATTRWGGFTQATYTVGRFFVDNDGNLFGAPDLRNKGTLYATGVRQMGNSAERIVVLTDEGLFVAVPQSI